jgi:hypothetical protein
LEGYNEFEAAMILGLGGGDSEYHIEYGVERYEHFKALMERTVALETLKNGQAGEEYFAGAAAGAAARDPVRQLLNSLGYRTFDYTKEKSLDGSVPQTNRFSNDRIVQDIIFGNIPNHAAEDDERKAASAAMYS